MAKAKREIVELTYHRTVKNDLRVCVTLPGHASNPAGKKLIMTRAEALRVANVLRYFLEDGPKE